MPTYLFDPTGSTLQNKVIGESKTLNLPSGRSFLFVVPAFGPFFEETLVIKHVPLTGPSKILTPFVDYNCGFQFVEATRKANRAIYGCINLINITLTGSLVFNYQALGGDYELTTANITAIQANEARDPMFTKWEDVLSTKSIALIPFPVVDHPWSKINVSDIKDAVHSLEEAGLVVHLRPKFLPNPQEEVYIPSKSELGLGNVQNYSPATNTEAIAGVATNRYMTPANTKAAIEPQVSAYLNSIGYRVPVNYSAGIILNNVQQTVLYQNNVYAPRSQFLPFTTNGSFERARFILINSNNREKWSAPILFNITGTETVNLTGAKIFNTGLTFDSKIETKIVLNNVIDLVYKTDYNIDNGQIFIEYPIKANDRLEFFYRRTASLMPKDRDYYKLYNVLSGVNTFTLTDMDFVDPDDLRVTLNDFIILSKGTDYTITGNTLTVTYQIKLGDVIEVENLDSIPFLGKQPMREILFDPNFLSGQR